MAAKMTVAVVGGLAPIVIWLFTTFETVGAAEQKWAEHNKAIQCRTVYELQEKVRSYLERLRFDSGLTPDQRAWIQAEINTLEHKIERLDPKGDC